MAEKNKINFQEYNTVLYIVAMLKKYGITNIIGCPGVQDAYFCSLVQDDSFFNCYSVVDERSAVYVASGIAYETGKPVIVACTGATSSRNFLSGMTEAFYRNIPVIALTFYNVETGPMSLSAQYVNRNNTQDDVKRISVTLPRVNDKTDWNSCMMSLNAALSAAVYKNQPVHINAPSCLDITNKNLPENIWSTEIYDEASSELIKEFENKRTIIYIGAHNKFTQEETKAISDFAVSHNIPVVCNHTSSYHGSNKILVPKVTKLINLDKKPELIIDIGNVNEDYYVTPFFMSAKEIWRISPNGEFKSRRSRPLKKLFTCSELSFFKNLINKNKVQNGYFDYMHCESEKINIPDLPMCNPFICQELTKHIQKNSSLYLAILNSARSMNFFELDESIDVNCNTGGFGIDGGLSSLIGQSLVSSNKTFYGVIGDLSFFYDMNVLGIRHIGKNLRIIVVNNNRGEEFRLNPKLEKPLADKTDVLISAAGHYKCGVKNWAEACNFKYLTADNKEDFTAQIKDFCNADYGRSVIFEVFTKNEDEQNGLNMLLSLNETKQETTKEKKSLLGKIFNIK